jgi:hypothetical protein
MTSDSQLTTNPDLRLSPQLWAGASPAPTTTK